MTKKPTRPPMPTSYKAKVTVPAIPNQKSVRITQTTQPLTDHKKMLHAVQTAGIPQHLSKPYKVK